MGFMALDQCAVDRYSPDKPVLRCLEDYTRAEKGRKRIRCLGGAYWTEGEGGLLELGTIFPGMEVDMEMGEGGSRWIVLLRGTGGDEFGESTLPVCLQSQTPGISQGSS